MFTGIIDSVGTIVSTNRTPAGIELRVSAPYRDLIEGESIALNGACLTVREFTDREFTVAAVATTIDRTAIGDWRSGTRVNLERAVRADTRLGGHIVQGHVDGVGTVVTVSRRADAVLVDIAVPPELERDLVPLGSIAVDGVSLTVNDTTAGKLQVSLIEYTLQHTALDELSPGQRVHLETDVIAKHVRRLVEQYLNDTLAIHRGQDE